MDNEASKAIRQQVLKLGAAYLLFEPKNHHTNATEQAM